MIKRFLPTKSPALGITLILVFIGLIFISISSLSEANSTVGDKFFFVKKQFIWLGIGTVAMFILSRIKLGFIKNISFVLYVISIITLFIVLIPHFGNSALGARRWLDLGFFGIQPSELVKLTSVIYFPFLFSKKDKQNIKSLLIYLGLPFLLIIAEPNLSTAILISTIVISIYYLSGGEVVGLFKICSVAVLLSILLVFTSPYRFARFKTFLDPTQNTSSTSYHTSQILLALASGGWFGKGFANSDQKYKFIPKVSTDSILAVIGEETGFIGLLLILYLYFYLIFYLFKLSQQVEDEYQSLLVSGIACWLTYQTLINISAIAALIPLTGVPLPFVSYGGSSLLTLLCAMGLVWNVEKEHDSLLYSTNAKNDKKIENPKEAHHNHRNPPHTGHRTNKTT